MSRVQLTYTPAAFALTHDYRVSLTGLQDWTAPDALAIDNIVDGLADDTTYDFQVRGVNNTGPGNWSNIATATTFPSPAAVFTTNFGTYTTGVAPPDWSVVRDATAIIQNGGTISGKMLMVGNGAGVATWNEIPSVADVDIYAVMSVSDNAGANTFGPSGRVLDGNNHYIGGLRTASAASDRGNLITARLAGTLNTIGQQLNISVTADTWYAVRYQVIGTDHKLKRWLFGNSEPGTWNIEVTDNNIVGSGAQGIGRTSAFSNVFVRCQYFSIGINGGVPEIL